MFDLAYEPDTEVVDAEEAPTPITRSRVPTGELAMHVRLDDGWHRSDPDGLATPCDQPVNARLQLETRNERLLEHPLALCECWTRKERRKADDAYRQKYGRDYRP